MWMGDGKEVGAEREAPSLYSSHHACLLLTEPLSDGGQLLVGEFRQAGRGHGG